MNTTMEQVAELLNKYIVSFQPRHREIRGGTEMKTRNFTGTEVTIPFRTYRPVGNRRTLR